MLFCRSYSQGARMRPRRGRERGRCAPFYVQAAPQAAHLALCTGLEKNYAMREPAAAGGGAGRRRVRCSTGPCRGRCKKVWVRAGADVLARRVKHGTKSWCKALLPSGSCAQPAAASRPEHSELAFTPSCTQWHFARTVACNKQAIFPCPCIRAITAQTEMARQCRPPPWSHCMQHCMHHEPAWRRSLSCTADQRAHTHNIMEA